MHYMQCAPLWLLAGEALQCTPPFSIAKRLCIDEPTPEQVRLLALCFQGYHYAKSLCEAGVKGMHGFKIPGTCRQLYSKP